MATVTVWAVRGRKNSVWAMLRRSPREVHRLTNPFEALPRSGWQDLNAAEDPNACGGADGAP